MMKVFIFVFLIFGTKNVYSDVFVGQFVTKVYSGYSHKGIFFKVSTGDARNPSGCKAGLNQTFAVDPEFSNVNHVLSVLLFAQAATKQVEVEFYSDKCYQNHRVIRKVAVY